MIPSWVQDFPGISSPSHPEMTSYMYSIHYMLLVLNFLAFILVHTAQLEEEVVVMVSFDFVKLANSEKDKLLKDAVPTSTQDKRIPGKNFAL